MTVFIRPSPDGSLEWANVEGNSQTSVFWQALNTDDPQERGSADEATLLLPTELVRQLPHMPIGFLTLSGLRWLHLLRNKLSITILGWTVESDSERVSVPLWCPVLPTAEGMTLRTRRVVGLLAAAGLVFAIISTLLVHSAELRNRQLQQDINQVSIQIQLLETQRQALNREEADRTFAGDLKGWAAWMTACVTAATVNKNVPERVVVQWDPPLDLGDLQPPARLRWSVELGGMEGSLLQETLRSLRGFGLPMRLVETRRDGADQSNGNGTTTVLSGQLSWTGRR